MVAAGVVPAASGVRPARGTCGPGGGLPGRSPVVAPIVARCAGGAQAEQPWGPSVVSVANEQIVTSG